MASVAQFSRGVNALDLLRREEQKIKITAKLKLRHSLSDTYTRPTAAFIQGNTKTSKKKAAEQKLGGIRENSKRRAKLKGIFNF